MTSDRNEMIENKNLVISFSVGVSIILGLSCAGKASIEKKIINSEFK